MTIVSPKRWLMLLNRFRIETVVSGSSADVASSQSRIRGCIASAGRCRRGRFSPPLSSEGYRSALSPRPTKERSSLLARIRCALGVADDLHGEGDVPRRRPVGEEVEVLKHHAEMFRLHLAELRPR